MARPTIETHDQIAARRVEQALKVTCPRCEAAPGATCVSTGILTFREPMATVHVSRARAARSA